jgi:hypothetical protein
MIRMEVHPEKSTGSVTNNVPTSNTSEVTTNVMVPDGATIVIGGLIENTDSTFQQGTLGLSRLPVVGPLFRQKFQTTVKRELIVLLTPRIWNPGGAAAVTLGASGSPTSTPSIIGLASASPIPTSNPRTEPAGRAALDPRSAPPPTPPAEAGSQSQVHPSAGPQRSTGASAPILPSPASRGAQPLPEARTNATRAPNLTGTLASSGIAASELAHRDPAILRASANANDLRGEAHVSKPPENTPPLDADPGYPRHVVRLGENFWTISQRYYGTGRYSKALWSANRADVPAMDRLAAGMTIAVPPVEDLDPALVIRDLIPRPRQPESRASLRGQGSTPR